MRFKAWLIEREITPKQAAFRLGVSAQAVYRYLLEPGSKHFRRPIDDVMAAIYVWTEGAVTPTDFYRLPDLPARTSCEAAE